MKKKGVILLVSFGLFVFVSVLYQKILEQQAVAKKEAALIIVKENQVSVTTKGAVYQEIQGFLDDAGYLIEGIRQEDLDQVKQTLTNLKTENTQLVEQYDWQIGWIRPIEDAEAHLAKIQNKFEIQEAINQLFLSDEELALSGQTFNAHLPLKLNLTQIDVQRLQKTLDENFTNQESNWKKMIASSLDIIHEQVILIENVNRILTKDDTIDEEHQKLLEILIANIKSPETKDFYLAKQNPEEEVLEETKIYDKDGNELSLNPPKT